jgi:hypothetical protein
MSPLEVQIATQREQTFEAATHHEVDRSPAQSAIGGGHPAVGKVAIVRKQDAQRLVDAQQVTGAIQQIAAIAERIAFAISRQRRTIVRGQSQHGRLLRRRQLPMIEQLHEQAGQALSRLARSQVHRDRRHLQRQCFHRRPPLLLLLPS